MTDEPNPRAVAGANKPPLDAGPDLVARLELEEAATIDAVMALEARRLKLPASPATDEDAATITDWLAEVGKLGREAEKRRKAVTDPYLAAQREVKGWFDDLLQPATGAVETWKRTLNTYTSAKAERERADRLAREAQEREIAAKAREKAAEELRAAQAAEIKAAEAREALRTAASQADRETQERLAREASQEVQRRTAAAEETTKEAVQAERIADTHGRAADGPVGALSRVTGAGASTVVTKFWTHAITDAQALMDSLGIVGRYLTNDAISQALAKAVRDGERTLPGCRVWQDSRTDVRSAR